MCRTCPFVSVHARKDNPYRMVSLYMYPLFESVKRAISEKKYPKYEIQECAKMPLTDADNSQI